MPHQRRRPQGCHRVPQKILEKCTFRLIKDPTYMKAHLNLALAYEKTDNPEEAFAAYKKIIEINPSDIKSQLKVK